MRIHWFAAVAVAITLALSGCMAMQQRAMRSQSVQVDQAIAGAVHVISRNGSVEIVADPSIRGAEITAKLYCRGATVEEAEQRVAQASVRADFESGGALVIEPIFPGEKPRDGDGASFQIRIASADGVTIDTSNGRVSASGLRGQLRIDTSNGSVTVNDHDGPAFVDTSNGKVELNHVFGSITVDTSNQSVHATNVGAPAIIDTSNGSITLVLAGDQAGPMRLDTSNGSIRARVGKAFAGKVIMDTSNGSVRVNDRQGRLTSTSLQRTSGIVEVGSGGEASKLDSSNGSIELTVEG